MPKSMLLAAVLLAGVVVAAPAFAFSVEPAPTNADGSAKFADPDDLADNMADGLSDGASAGYFDMFGAGNATVGFNAMRSGLGTVTSQGTFQRPYDPNDPTTH
jgi:hypothetical protein